MVTEVIHRDGVCTVAVRGEVDVANAPALREALQVTDQAKSAAVIDITRVSYMDSSGFAALLDTARRLRPRGVALHLVGSNSTITRLMEITRLNTVFQMHDTVDQAQQVIAATGSDGFPGEGLPN